jgi:hypothetical protein
VGGADQIIDEPIVSPTASPAGTVDAGDKPNCVTRQIEISMVTTGSEASTAVLKGGYQERFEWKTSTQTISDAPVAAADSTTGVTAGGITGAPAGATAGAAAGLNIDPKPAELIVKFEATPEGPKVTTADVVTTVKGTTDKVTGDVLGADGTIDTSNGIHVSANNDIKFSDGTTFSHDGRIQLADGKVLAAGSGNNAQAQASESAASQAAAAAAAASGVAAMVAGKAGSGQITMSDIAALQAAIGDVNALVGVCMDAGNLQAAQSMMNTSAGLSGALDSATASFTRNTAFRATGLTSVGSPGEEGRYNSMRYKFAA